MPRWITYTLITLAILTILALLTGWFTWEYWSRTGDEASAIRIFG